MRSVPPDPNALDAAWSLDERGPESTRVADPAILSRQATVAEGPAAPPAGPQLGAPGPQQTKSTLPPPVPVNEYVAKMMVRRSHSSSEITAVQHTRPSDAPTQEFPKAPGRKTIPWEPPPSGSVGAASKPSAAPREQPKLGLECDEPGVASRPSARLGFGSLSERGRRLAPDLDDDELLLPPSEAPSYPRSELDAVDSPHMSWRVPHSGNLKRSGPGGDLSDIDFRLDLGLGFEEPAMPPDELPPMTPPPGTLRYGLVEDDDEFDLRGPAGPNGPEAYRAGALPRGALPTLQFSDADLEQATAPGMDMSAHLFSSEPGLAGEDPRSQMVHRFEQGDYGGALVFAEGLLAENPRDSMAGEYAMSCTEALRQMYKARLGDGSRVLRLGISPEHLRSLNLDHRAGFLLSCIDGYSSIDEILDVSGMPTLEALRILYELVQEGIVAGD